MYRCTLRSTQKLHPKSLLSKSKVGNGVARRQNSTNSGGGGSGLYIGATVVTISGLIGGATAYAGQSVEFRKSIEDAIPFSKSVFDMVHGDIPLVKKSVTPVEVDLSIPFIPEVLKEENVSNQTSFSDHKEETFSEKISVDTAPVVTFEANTEDTLKPLVLEETYPLTPSTEVAGDSEAIPQTKESLDIQAVEDTEVAPTQTLMFAENEEVIPYSMEREEPLTEEEIENLAKIVDKEAMEILITVSLSCIETLSDKVTQSHKGAASALRQYMKAFAAAMPVTMEDKDYEVKVQELVEIEHESQTLMDEAKQNELQLRSEIESLHHLVNKIRENNATSDVADKAEQVVDENKNNLEAALETVDSVQKDFDFLLKYQDFVDEAPSELQHDLKLFSTDMLDLIGGDSKELKISSLPYEQAVLLLALKRQQLYSNATRQATGLDAAQVEELLEKQRKELNDLAAEGLAVELKRIEEEKNIEREHKVKELGDNYEREMLSQLKRQASAHSEHLAEELAEQAKTLDQQHRTELETKLNELQKMYYRELEKKVKSISAIQGKISDVVDVETRQRNTQELWIAAQALNGTLDVTTLNGRTRTLMPEVISILQLVERNATLTEIVDSLPEQAVLFGVVPEKDLLQRFKPVKAACKRVAAVQDGDSLLKYVLSYVKSVFVISRWYLTDVEEAVNVEKLTCYEILAKAEHFIQEGDLETAAKLMSQLTGVARKLSGDWLNEVRLLLETKQTALLLQAYAASLAAGLE